MTVNNINSMVQQSMNQIASGKRINGAADDAAGLAIAEKLVSQSNGMDKGIDNAHDMKNLVRTAEGGVSGIQENLQRIRELAVQAGSSILTDSDRGNIQKEIDQLKQGIQNIANNTQFNTQKLLNGSFQNKQAVTGANGSSLEVSVGNTGVASLGIENFDVTKSFDIEDLDKAINSISAERSKMGALENRLQNSISNNEVARENIEASRSRIQDSDIAKTINDLKKNQIIQQYQYYAQNMRAQSEQQKLGIMG